MKRVVVTGMSAITALGNTWDTFVANVDAGKTATSQMPEWGVYPHLNARLAAPLRDFVMPAQFTRRHTRSMGKVALYAVAATENALARARLLNDPSLKTGHAGVAYGSCVGAIEDIGRFGTAVLDPKSQPLDANSFLRMMPHTTAVNIGVHYGLQGRVLPTSSACTSGSQGVGFAYEAIKWGKQKIMLAGGAEELCVADVMVFDTLYAASSKNDTPAKTPRPFDLKRDGLVIGEGAATLVLEELEFAKARGATILAEVVGFGSNSDGTHVTRPQTETMELAMRLALEDANLSPDAVGYVNAHGTATEHGDIAESQATHRVFGKAMPLSTAKGHLGHTLGACGAIEAWLTIEMLNRDTYLPTANLTEVDPRCGALDYVIGSRRVMSNEVVMSNNFAFGGINTSLIFKRWH